MKELKTTTELKTEKPADPSKPPQKTALEKLLDKKGIGYFEATRLMGVNPKNNVGYWKKKITGQQPMTVEELAKLCTVAEINANLVKVQIVTMLMK